MTSTPVGSRCTSRWTGALAVAALTSFALSLDHDLDATVMILVWNLGTAALITAIGGLLGRRMFLWVV
jgi:hypothetical protein